MVLTLFYIFDSKNAVTGLSLRSSFECKCHRSHVSLKAWYSNFSYAYAVFAQHGFTLLIGNSSKLFKHTVSAIQISLTQNKLQTGPANILLRKMTTKQRVQTRVNMGNWYCMGYYLEKAES